MAEVKVAVDDGEPRRLRQAFRLVEQIVEAGRRVPEVEPLELVQRSRVLGTRFAMSARRFASSGSAAAGKASSTSGPWRR